MPYHFSGLNHDVAQWNIPIHRKILQERTECHIFLLQKGDNVCFGPEAVFQCPLKHLLIQGYGLFSVRAVSWNTVQTGIKTVCGSYQWQGKRIDFHSIQ